MKVKKHLKTLRSKMSHASRQDNKFQQDAQVCCLHIHSGSQYFLKLSHKNVYNKKITVSN